MIVQKMRNEALTLQRAERIQSASRQGRKPAKRRRQLEEAATRLLQTSSAVCRLGGALPTLKDFTDEAEHLSTFARRFAPQGT